MANTSLRDDQLYSFLSKETKQKIMYTGSLQLLQENSVS